MNTYNFNHLESRLINSLNWVSFDPQGRGKRELEYYNAALAEDIEEIKKYGADDEAVARYFKKFEQLLSALISAQSNCASSFITGGSNFNVPRAERNNNRLRSHEENLKDWRIKVVNAYRLKFERAKKTELIQNAGGEAALMRLKIEEAKKQHEKNKQGNKEIAKAKKEGRDISGWLMAEFDIKPHMIDWAMRFGVVSSTATANIRRMEQRLQELEAKEARQESGEQIEKFSGNGWEFVQNNEADRYQFIFEGKPSAEIIALMKKYAFKWSPRFGAWQRQITANAAWTIKRNVIPQLTELTAVCAA